MKHIAKLLWLTFLIPLLSSTASAQDSEEETSRWQIGLTAGINIPLSDFADKLDENFKSGYAILGATSRLRASYHPNSKLYIAADYVWFYNPVNATELLNSLVETNPPGPRYKTTTYPWKVNSLLLGLGTTLNFNEQTDATLRGMLGFANGKYSKRIYQSFDGVKTLQVTENASSVLDIALNLGFEVKYCFHKNIGVMFAGDYFRTEFNYDDVYLIYSETGEKRSTGAYSQPVDVFQFSAGIFTKF
ncbi:MAG TPA: hypothetical protein PKY09_05355 [Bacteroidia bacterium]|nr:hypothetical protein [Bacteroidia bacterium]HNN10523.1 hypothetical protein [Bacteroidia bacterium]